MAYTKMYEQQIIDMIWGATLLGGGGGGSMQNGLDLLAKYKEAHPGPVTVIICEAEDMNEGEYAAVTAGMGAPSAIQRTDFSAYATNAFVALQEMAAKMTPPKNLKYSLAVEMGGFNTFVPMLISLVNNIPLIDADGAGRAVPALNTLLLHVNGCDTSPLAMANGDNDKINIELNDPRNAELAEEIGRHICMAFDMMSGLAGWMLQKEEIKNKIVTNSVTKAKDIGGVFRECIAKGDVGNVLEALFERKIVEGKVICKGVVTGFETIQEEGFDRGEVFISDFKDPLTSWQIDFQNENLLLSKFVGGAKIPYMTVPDIICMYDLKTGAPLTNADISLNMEVALGVLAVDDKWWLNPSMFDVWRPLLARVGYTGENLPYRKL